jgi:glutamate carboxypeptidase
MTGKTRVVERLADIVSAETPSGDHALMSSAQHIVNSWIAPVLGDDGDLVDVDGTRHLLWTASGRPRVLLLGHLDTVWPRETVMSRPFAVDGDRATGPGVFDMKAGIVIMAEALARAARPQDVGVLITSDEEIGSPTSRHLIEREAARSDAVLLLEPSMGGAVKTTRKGGSFYRIDFLGRAAHAGLEPEAGRSALVELAHTVLGMTRLADTTCGTTVNPTVARAGTATNVIPERAEMRVDVRAWTMTELQRVDEAIKQLRAVTPEVEVSVVGGINRPPMEDEASRGLFALARTEARRLRQRELHAVSAGGASDGNFTAALGTPTLDGLGPDGGGAHAVDEWVSINSVTERIDLVVGMLDALTRPGTPDDEPAGRRP